MNNPGTTDSHTLLTNVEGLNLTGHLPDDDAFPLKPPTVQGDLGFFGGHRIIRLVGRGGMGLVFEAIDVALNRKVALKVLKPRIAASPKSNHRFLTEARSAAKIRHPNVVTIYSIDLDDGIPFLTMEFLNGSTLESYARNHQLSYFDCIRIGRSIALGLSEAHGHGIIHRDIKPDNIWIESNGDDPFARALILDFGLATSADAGSSYGAAGRVVGTPNYLSPELALGRPVDHRTDLYSYGCLLYRIITNRLPFNGSELRELIERIIESKPTPIAEHKPEAPADLIKLVERLMSRDPAKRPEAIDVAYELTRIERENGGMIFSTDGLKSGLATQSLDSKQWWRIATLEEITQTKIGSSEIVPLDSNSRHRTLMLVSVFASLIAICLGTLAFLQPGQRPLDHSASAVEKTVPPQRALQRIFNGTDLTGWFRKTPDESTPWSIENGSLVSKATKRDDFLLTDEEYGDFELRIDYRWRKNGGHTTLVIRGWETENHKVDGLLINLGDDEGFPKFHKRPIGQLYQTGGIQRLSVSPISANNKIGDWNSIVINAVGSTIEVKHNGTLTTFVQLDNFKSKARDIPAVLRTKGHIGLLSHWGEIEYRNISIREY